MKPFLEYSLKEYVTSSTADAHTGLLLDGADRVKADLEHLGKRIKLLESVSVEPKKLNWPFKPERTDMVKALFRMLSLLVWIYPCRSLRRIDVRLAKRFKS